MNAIFITGTDTGVGKTWVTQQLLHQFNHQGYQTFAMKPLASGADYDVQAQQFKNEDACLLQKAASLSCPYSVVNPFLFKEPIAPHLAAEKEGIRLECAAVKQQIIQNMHPEADIQLIEGVGGWAVPLNAQQLFAEVIVELNIPVILVVGIRLGCLNHALLTQQSMMQMNVRCLGWIANELAPHTAACTAMITTLQQWIPQPCLGVLPYGQQEVPLFIEPIERYLASAKKFRSPADDRVDLKK